MHKKPSNSQDPFRKTIDFDGTSKGTRVPRPEIIKSVKRENTRRSRDTDYSQCIHNKGKTGVVVGSG